MMRRMIIAVSAVAVAVAAGGTPAGAAPRVVAKGHWGVSSYVANPTSAFSSIATSSPTNAWVVGGPIQRWNGKRWNTVTSPRVSSFEDASFGEVATRSASDTWIAGSGDHGNYYQFTGLAAHWYRGSWHVHVLGKLTAVMHIAEFSTNNVWLLGAKYSDTKSTTGWYWHWNGARWSQGKLPAVPGEGTGSPAWSGTTPIHGSSGALHYVGGRWVLSRGLQVRLQGDARAYGVYTVVQHSVHNVDALVSFYRDDALTNGLAVYHWNGHSWKLAKYLPNDYPETSAPDGSGGIWVYSGGLRAVGRVIDIRGGRVVAVANRPTYKVGDLDITDLALHPGTHTLWAVGATDGVGAGGGSHAVVAAWHA